MLWKQSCPGGKRCFWYKQRWQQFVIDPHSGNCSSMPEVWRLLTPIIHPNTHQLSSGNVKGLTNHKDQEMQSECWSEEQEEVNAYQKAIWECGLDLWHDAWKQFIWFPSTQRGLQLEGARRRKKRKMNSFAHSSNSHGHCATQVECAVRLT